MVTMIQALLGIQIWKDSRGQDLVEYALIAGLIAVVGGAIMPGGEGGINVVFRHANSIMIAASS
jgi:pilus assembly protein Flp/PilA